MSGISSRKLPSVKSYVVGRRNFAAISAVEGLVLQSESEQRLERTSSLSPSKRRAETVRAFSRTQKRG